MPSFAAAASRLLAVGANSTETRWRCDDLSAVPVDQACKFLTSTCLEDSRIPWNTIYYCHVAPAGSLAIGLFMVFLTVFTLPLILSLLADTADMFFSPITALLAQITHMRPRVAGVTLVAIGNAAADLSSNIAAIRSGQVTLGLGAQIGAAMFVQCLVMSQCVTISQGATFGKGSVRDSLVLSSAAVLIAVCLGTKYTGIVFAILAMLLYSAFVISVVFSGKGAFSWETIKGSLVRRRQVQVQHHHHNPQADLDTARHAQQSGSQVTASKALQTAGGLQSLGMMLDGGHSRRTRRLSLLQRASLTAGGLSGDEAANTRLGLLGARSYAMAALADVADEVLDANDIEELAKPPSHINSAAFALFGHNTLLAHTASVEGNGDWDDKTVHSGSAAGQGRSLRPGGRPQVETMGGKRLARTSVLLMPSQMTSMWAAAKAESMRRVHSMSLGIASLQSTDRPDGEEGDCSPGPLANNAHPRHRLQDITFSNPVSWEPLLSAGMARSSAATPRLTLTRGTRTTYPRSEPPPYPRSEPPALPSHATPHLAPFASTEGMPTRLVACSGSFNCNDPPPPPSLAGALGGALHAACSNMPGASPFVVSYPSGGMPLGGLQQAASSMSGGMLLDGLPQAASSMPGGTPLGGFPQAASSTSGGMPLGGLPQAASSTYGGTLLDGLQQAASSTYGGTPLGGLSKAASSMSGVMLLDGLPQAVSSIPGGMPLGGFPQAASSNYGGMPLGGLPQAASSTYGGTLLDGLQQAASSTYGGTPLGGLSKAASSMSGGMLLDGLPQAASTMPGGTPLGGLPQATSSTFGSTPLGGLPQAASSMPGGTPLGGLQQAASSTYGGTPLDGLQQAASSTCGGMLLDGVPHAVSSISGGMPLGGLPQAMYSACSSVLSGSPCGGRSTDDRPAAAAPVPYTMGGSPAPPPAASRGPTLMLVDSSLSASASGLHASVAHSRMSRRSVAVSLAGDSATVTQYRPPSGQHQLDGGATPAVGAGINMVVLEMVSVDGEGDKHLQLKPDGEDEVDRGEDGKGEGEQPPLLPASVAGKVIEALDEVTVFNFSDEWLGLPTWRFCVRMLFFLITSPVYLAMRLTIPVVEPEKFRWPWFLLTCLLCPLGVVGYMMGHMNMNAMAAGAGACVGVAFCACMALVLWRCGWHGVPTLTCGKVDVAMLFFLLLGFATAVMWIDVLANELVACVVIIAARLRIPQSLLGITLLAWGSSVGDLVTNLSLSRRGLVGMAIAASFASPIMNLLLSSGIGFLLLALTPPKGGVTLSLPPEIALGASTLVLWGAALCLMAWRGKWLLQPKGMLLLGRGLYLAFFVGAFLLAFLM